MGTLTEALHEKEQEIRANPEIEREVWELCKKLSRVMIDSLPDDGVCGDDVLRAMVTLRMFEASMTRTFLQSLVKMECIDQGALDHWDEENLEK
jgi:hypothetical protein